MPQHTPGPWHVAPFDWQGTHNEEAVFQVGNPLFPIIVSAWGDNLEQSSANARLIAAAPELLAALNELEQVSSNYCDTFAEVKRRDLALKRARDAIAKAEGVES